MLVGVNTSQPFSLTATMSSILTPHLPGKYTPGSIGDHHARPQDFFLPSCDSRRLMDFQPHAMPGGMREITSQPGLAQHLTRRFVHLATLIPGRTAAIAACWASLTDS